VTSNPEEKDQEREAHVVSHLCISQSDEGQMEKSEWFLFNDFSVSVVDEGFAQVTKFTSKTPCILQYVSTGKWIDFWTRAKIEIATAGPASISPFKGKIFEKGGARRSGMLKKKLSVASPEVIFGRSSSSLPGLNDIVAIDCEFVALSEEVAEYVGKWGVTVFLFFFVCFVSSHLHFAPNYSHSLPLFPRYAFDGRRVVREPMRLGLGRVSVLDGRMRNSKDHLGGKHFIDDYIISPEPIVDFLTRFSGLHIGDLDPSISPHHLIPLKIVYLKLRHLVDSGCIFVGHGLTTDFRIINLFVPPAQVKDTVELYRLPGQRKISLRFLAAYVLQKGIQGDTHDSIEDARIALLLYRKYLELERQGKEHVSRMIHAIYECGRKTKWKSANGITVS